MNLIDERNQAPPTPAGLVETYRHQGFVHVPGVLSRQEVEKFASAAEKLLASETLGSWESDHQNPVLQLVSDPWLHLPELRDLTFHPAICRAAEALAGQSLRLFSSEILLKAPGKTAPTTPHDDDPAVPVSPNEGTLTAWVALVDVPVERGCMSFIPGSHRRRTLDWQNGNRSEEAAFDVFGTWPELSWQPRVTIPLKAGDCTFHNVRTIHMAGPNTSDAKRVSATATYVASDGTYVPFSEAGAVEGLVVGQQLPDDDYPRLS